MQIETYAEIIKEAASALKQLETKGYVEPKVEKTDKRKYQRIDIDLSDDKACVAALKNLPSTISKWKKAQVLCAPESDKFKEYAKNIKHAHTQIERINKKYNG